MDVTSPADRQRALLRAWEQARDELTKAANAGRAAQQRWDIAVSRELEAHRRLREAIDDGPHGC